MKMLDSGDASEHPYVPLFQAFFDALRAGTGMPHAGLHEALRTHEIVFAAERSLAAGAPVSL